jgi:hypothetical protein
MQVTVTEDHIEMGSKKSIYACPIAKAIYAATRERFNVAGAYCRNYRTGVAVSLPVEVSDRIRNYDVTGEMQPFTFEMEYEPCESK